MTPEQIRRLLDQLLDRGFDQAVEPILLAASRDLDSGALANALRQLDAEARRLADAGERLTANNPVLRAVWGDVETALRNQRALINNAGGDVLQSAIDAAEGSVRGLALGLDGLGTALDTVGIGWNTPDPEVIARIVDYTSSPAWRALLEEYARGGLDDLQAMILAQIIDGTGARAIARSLRDSVEGMLISDANTLVRTLQLTAWRDAETVYRMANADILSYQVRIADLSGCCLSCLSLHGTILPLDARIDDHPNGLCTSISMVRGMERDIQSGADYFAGLSEAQKRERMGDANYAAYQAGKVQLQDFVGKREDDVFGEQLYELSLKGVLGDGAKDYYGR